MRFMHLVAPLSRLFRSAPPAPPTAENGAAALDSRSPELINATALGQDKGAAGDEALRAAAIRKLQDGEVLRKLAGLGGTSPPPPASASAGASLERTAQERMAQLLDAGAIDFGSLCATTENTSALLPIAGL